MAGIETFLHSLPNPYKYKDTWIKANGKDVETLILGNSHNYYGIMPSVLGHKSFNCANVSQLFDQDLYLLKRYKPVCKKLKRVIINVDFSNIFDAPLQANEPFRVTYYHLYMDMPLPTCQKKAFFELFYISAAKEKVTNYINGKALSFDSLGWGNDHKLTLRDSSALSKEGSKARAANLRCKDFSDYLHNKQVLSEIAKYCDNNKLQLIIISTPVSRGFYSYESARDKKLLREAIQPLLDYKSVSYIDFSQDNNINDKDFFDSDHLDDAGAKKFSKQLSACIN